MPEYSLNHRNFLAIAREVLNAGQPISFRAVGSSMRPFILDGDLLEIVSCKVGEIRRGDVLIFEDHPNHLLVHRVIKMRKDRCLLMKGDAARYPDGWFQSGQVIGRVRSVIGSNDRHRWSWHSLRWIALGYSLAYAWLRRVLI